MALRESRVTIHMAASLDGFIARKDGRVDWLETADELSPLLGWLATLPLREVNIEPVGLRAVYDRFHAEGRLAPGSPADSIVDAPEPSLQSS